MNTPTPTPPSQPAPQPRKITQEERPQFPCWLWSYIDGNPALNGWWWRCSSYGVFDYDKRCSDRAVYWLPDQPTAPECRPDQPQPSALAAATLTRSGFGGVAGMVQRPYGDYVLFCEVEKLLATQTAAHEAKVAELEAKQPINTHVRLFDLVRQQRAELHEAELITDEEYAWLSGGAPLATCKKGGSPSPRRLEDYDDLQDQLFAARQEAETLAKRIKELEETELEYSAFCAQFRRKNKTLICHPSEATKTINTFRAELAALRNAATEAGGVLQDIHLLAHCIAKAGPLNTPTLEVAWSKFELLAVKAVEGISRSLRPPPDPRTSSCGR